MNLVRRSAGRRARRVVRAAPLVAVLAAGLIATGAAPGVASQLWRLDSLANTSVAPGESLTFYVQLTNVGDTEMDGSDASITASLPSGMTAEEAVLLPNAFSAPRAFVACTAGDGVSPVAGATSVRCTSPFALPPSVNNSNLFEIMTLRVHVDGAAQGTPTVRFAVEGGGAPTVEAVDPTVVTTAPPVFDVDLFDGRLGGASGSVLSQAGGHPVDATVALDFTSHTDPAPLAGDAAPIEPLKNVFVDLPPGLVGDPTVIDKCTSAQLAFTSGLSAIPRCPPTSQVGVVRLKVNNRPSSQISFGPLPVFGIVPPPNVPARFGFNVAGSLVVLDAELRTGGDYGLSINARNVSEALGVVGTEFTFWGVPSDPSHDLERACPGQVAPVAGGPSCPSGKPQLAFLRNPTACTPVGVGLPTTVRVDSWADPGDFKQASFISHDDPGFPALPAEWGPPLGPTGCDRVPFDPRLEGRPVVRKPSSPSGFAFDLSLPQTKDFDLIGQSDLKTAVVTLPEGVRVNPAAADGLQACSPAQIHLHDANPADCPEASKVGTVTIATPLLDDPLQGSIYLAAPHDNPFGTLLSIYLAGQGSGVVIKLAGRVEANPLTGQLTTTFDDNPQTPFSNLHLEFDGGPRAQLVTPRQCKSYATDAVLTGWNGRVVQTTSTFSISGDGNGSPCPPPKFRPAFNAGTASNSAGSASSFLLRFAREGEDQEFGDLTVELPRGLTGKIANADLCSDAQARADACPANSKIGDVVTGAGAGSNPFYITNGKAYLTGPYKPAGSSEPAPFGVAIVVPAVAGPFDLGKVTVRSALFVDEKTAQVRIVSDPFPTILQGIPLDVRDVRVNVNKRDFFLNPTSCAEKSISATIASTEGMSARVSDRFQAAECASLGFKPRITIRVGGRGHTRRGRTTPFSATLRMPQRNQANLRFVRVTLPKTINARLTVINDACTRAEFESDLAKCTHAKAGTAAASTPLLRRPLRGNVYFVRNGNPIPDLFVALRGQVDFDLIGRVAIPGSTRLRTTFATAPDVPIRSFSLRLLGDARNGSVGAAANLCSRASRGQKVEVDYIGQNGSVRQVDQALKVGGCGKQGGRQRRR